MVKVQWIQVNSSLSLIILNYLLLSLILHQNYRLSAAIILPECGKLKEDLPSGVYDYSMSLRGDLKILGIALDEILPFGHSNYEVETVLTKARKLLTIDGWNKVSSRFCHEKLRDTKGDGKILVEAINLFHSMRDCLYKCDYMSSLTLAANYAAVFWDELYAIDDDRVKWTVLQVVELHRKKCMPNYLDKFHRIQLTLEFDSMKQLNTLFDTELSNKIMADHDIREMSSVSINEQLTQVALELYDKLEILARDTEEAKYFRTKKSGVGRTEYEVPPEFRSKTVAKHLIEPCRKFVRQFRDTFHPFRLDYILLNNTSFEDDEYSGLDHDPTGDREFMDFWKKYRFCNELSNDRARFADLISKQVPYKLGMIPPEIETTTTAITTPETSQTMTPTQQPESTTQTLITTSPARSFISTTLLK